VKDTRILSIASTKSEFANNILVQFYHVRLLPNNGWISWSVTSSCLAVKGRRARSAILFKERCSVPASFCC